MNSCFDKVLLQSPLGARKSIIHRRMEIKWQLTAENFNFSHSKALNKFIIYCTFKIFVFIGCRIREDLEEFADGCGFPEIDVRRLHLYSCYESYQFVVWQGEGMHFTITLLRDSSKSSGNAG